MEIIEAIRNHIITCPFLDSEGRVNVNYLTNEPVNYSIDPVPSVSILSEDIAGNTKRQYMFQFSSQESYGSDTLTQMATSGFFEKFSSWLEEQTNLGALPSLGTGKKATKIYASGQGFILSNTEDSASYAIQCGLNYEQEAL